MSKDKTKDGLLNLKKVNFIPSKIAVESANNAGWKAAEKIIVDKLAMEITNIRVKLIEAAVENIEKHDDVLLKIEPKQKPLYGANRQAVTEPCYTQDQIQEIDKREAKRNAIVDALNEFKEKYNEETEEKLKKAIEKNKA